MIFFGFFGYLADLCLYLCIAFYALFSLELQTSPFAIAFFAFPMALYTIMIIRRKRWILSQDAILSRLKLLLVVLPVLLFFTLISRSRLILTQLSLPFYFVTLFTLIMLLRLSRHANPSALPKKIYLLNALSLLAICLVAMVLSSRVFLNAVLTVLRWVYMHVLGPAFIYLAYGIVYGIVTIWNLIASLFRINRTLEVPDNPVNVIQNGEVPPEQTEVTGAPAWVNIVFIVLGLALFVAIVYFVARRLAMGRDTGYTEDSSFTQTETTPPSAQKPRAQDSRSQSPRNRVRHYFRKLLRLCRKKGLLTDSPAFTKGLSSEKACSLAETLAAPSDALTHLRALYLPARYSQETDISPEMAEEAQELWKDIKKSVQG